MTGAMTQPKRFVDSHVGVGGRKCNCCFPAPRSKARRGVFRSAKLASKIEARKLIAEAI